MWLYTQLMSSHLHLTTILIVEFQYLISEVTKLNLKEGPRTKELLHRIRGKFWYLAHSESVFQFIADA